MSDIAIKIREKIDYEGKGSCERVSFGGKVPL